MKPIRFNALSSAVLAVTVLGSGSLFALDLYWDRGAVSPFDWGIPANWSESASANTPDPAASPGAADTAFFTTSGLPTFAAQTVNLNATQSVQGIRTAAQTITTSLLGGGTAQILNLGTGGITHTNGGIIIGSATSGQQVAIVLQGTQIWDSSVIVGSTGAAAMVVNNGVSPAPGLGAQTLTLAGFNTGTTVAGSITSSGTDVLSIIKSGTGIWTLGGSVASATDYNGSTSINQGTLRLTNIGALNTVSSATSVAAGATLSLRVAGTIGFTSPQVDTIRTNVGFALGSFLGLDTNNADFTYASNITGNFGLSKLSPNFVLNLTGTNSYTGPTNVTEGRLALGKTASLSNFGNPAQTNVSANGSLTGMAGSGGFTSADLDSLRTAATYASGAGFGVDTTIGDFIYNTATTGDIRFVKTGLNTLILTGANTYTGVTNIAGGVIAVSSLGILGPNQIYLGTGGTGGRLRYTGTGETTNRVFRLEGSTGGGAIESSGSGALVLNSAVAGNAGSKNITLTGTNTGANTLVGSLANYGGGTNLTGVLKNGSGNWIFSGANTNTGITTIQGGSLTFDYGTADPFGGGALILQNGTVVFRGKPAATNETTSNLQFASANFGFNRLVLDANGGAGVNITAAVLTSSSTTQQQNLIDLSSSAGNSVTVTSMTGYAQVNGIVMNNGNAGAARANLIVGDTTGFGFALLAGGTSGAVQRLSTFLPADTNTTALTTGTTNYLFNAAGTHTTSANAVFSTLTFDSTNGAIDLKLGMGNTLSASTNGKALLFSGANDVAVSQDGTTSVGGASALWYHNYLENTAALNFSANIGSGQTHLFGGPGFTNYTGTNLGGSFVLNGGLFRIAKDQVLATTASYRITNGIFEIAADLNGGADDLTLGAGTGAGTMGLYGEAGLSAVTAAVNGTRTVDFTAASLSQTLVWGGTGSHFMTQVDGTSDGDFALRLSSDRANATLVLKNNINLNGRIRTVNVADGTADVDAVLSGVLSGSVATGLAKTGAGALSLTGANTYLGDTRVAEGSLVINSTSLAQSSRLRIDSPGTVSVTGTAYIAAVIINGVSQPSGPVVNAAVTGNLVVGAPPAGGPYEIWAAANIATPADRDPSDDGDFDSLLNLIEYAVDTNPVGSNGSVFSIGTTAPYTLAFNRRSGGTDITIAVQSSPDLAIGNWTTIAVSTLGGALTSNFGTDIVITDANNPTGGTPVTVTDNRSPEPERIFYRILVTKP